MRKIQSFDFLFFLIASQTNWSVVQADDEEYNKVALPFSNTNNV